MTILCIEPRFKQLKSETLLNPNINVTTRFFDQLDFLLPTHDDPDAFLAKTGDPREGTSPSPNRVIQPDPCPQTWRNTNATRCSDSSLQLPQNVLSSSDSHHFMLISITDNFNINSTSTQPSNLVVFLLLLTSSLLPSTAPTTNASVNACIAKVTSTPFY
ncbi:hypothetical protein TSMEX_002509 [Taenia solium]|eukprot:TsM_000549100 transcript=TsM_000549100 gene=TsM_000549100